MKKTRQNQKKNEQEPPPKKSNRKMKCLQVPLYLFFDGSCLKQDKLVESLQSSFADVDLLFSGPSV